MDNIKVILIWLFVMAVILFGLQHYKEKSEKLQTQLTMQEAQSKQLATDKQNEVDKTHDRANEYLRKAKEDYENKIAMLNSRIKSGSVSKPANNTNAGNRMPDIQKPAVISETKIVYKENAADAACELRYNELWETWVNLCLIYGCTD